MYFAKDRRKSISRKISKNVSEIYRKKLHDQSKHSATDAIKITLKEAIQQQTETNGDLIGNENADKSLGKDRKLLMIWN